MACSSAAGVRVPQDVTESGLGAAAQAVAGAGGRARVAQRLGQSGVQRAAWEALECLPGEGLHVGAAVVQRALQQGFEGVVVVTQGVQHGAQEAFAAGGAFRVELRAQQVAGGVQVEVSQHAVQRVAFRIAQGGPGGLVGDVGVGQGRVTGVLCEPAPSFTQHAGQGNAQAAVLRGEGQ